MRTRYFFHTLIGAICFLIAQANSDAQVRETPVTLFLIQGGNPQGYVSASNEQGVTFSTTPGGAGSLVEYSKMKGEGLNKGIVFGERAEALGDARALFAAGDYPAAAAAFGKVARDYAIILSVPQNFATEAFFYQIESLRRAGQFGQMANLVNAPVAAGISTKLSEYYVDFHRYQKLWALFGQEDWAGLKTAVADYEETPSGNETLLPTPPFSKLPSSELAQISFLRGKVYQQAGEKEKAFQDFHRSFLLTFANDPVVSKLALAQAMLIQSQDEGIAAENAEAIKHMQALTYAFATFYGDRAVPQQFEGYNVRPEVPDLLGAAPRAMGEDSGDEEGDGEAEPTSEDAEAAEDGKAKAKGKGKKAKE
ncbi:MAG: hypothetical protein AAF236_08165 [Verrucomicrobiota bacterium]